ncbi:MAG TPA: mycothiol conjugate amidase Mca [Egibacteraceae bacterium]|jgi:mycothiol S-conjugate amidase|nr:mycothiol conjugate amidase Mca [Egibacteraceae bacterium]
MPALHAMFVHAHPDDESSKGAATMARYAKEGYRVSVVTCTDGMAGDILNPAMDQPGVAERMREIREEELARALEILGVTDHFWLGYPDSGYVEDFDGDGRLLAADSFYNAPFEEATERLVRLVRAERPDVLVTYPEGGGYPHPDHIRCHDISVAAFDAAGDPERCREAGEPWQPRKLYYVGAFNRRKVEALHAACADRGIDSPFTGWLERFDPDAGDPSTTSVEVGDFIGLRSRALLAHATQIDPDGMWFRIPDEVVREIYPYEDFQLARSLVDTELPETSLFAGLE